MMRNKLLAIFSSLAAICACLSLTISGETQNAGSFVSLQGTSPGVSQPGNTNVAGTGRFGSVTMNGFQLGASATAGYVLTADASGVGTWQAPSGGGGSLTLPYTGSIDFNGNAFSLTNTNANGKCILLSETATSGNTYGLMALNSSSAGRAVYGLASSSSGFNVGVYGQSSSSTGQGVYGVATNTSGLNYGGYFQSNSSAGYGVWAQSSGAVGVYGLASSLTGLVYGGRFETSSTSGRALLGYALATTGVTTGVFGESDSVSGRAFFGFAQAPTGSTYGGLFQSASTSGTGIFGWASAASGTTVGVRGDSDSPTGYAGYFNGRSYFNGNVGINNLAPGYALDVSGVLNTTGFRMPTGATNGYILQCDSSGVGTWHQVNGGIVFPYYASTGNPGQPAFHIRNLTGDGIFGESNGDSTFGLKGAVSAGSGGWGVFGTSSNSGGTGVYGTATGTGNSVGGKFQANSTSGIAVYATSPATSGDTRGVYAQVTSDSGIAVYGNAINSGSGSAIGGQFVADSSSGYALYCDGNGGNGMYISSFKPAIYAITSGAGYPAIHGVIEATPPNTELSRGVWGETKNITGIGVYGDVSANSSGVSYGVKGRNSYAVGYGVYATGNMGASGTKTFRIDHPIDPLNKYLMHYSTEGPEPLNIYRGNVTTDAKGVAWVELPDYFGDINRDPTFQLTVIEDVESDTFVRAKVVGGIHDNRFKIRTNAPNVRVSWRVEAVRNDAWVRAYGAPVVVDKAQHERGKYQHPELYGAPPELAVDYSKYDGARKSGKK